MALNPFDWHHRLRDPFEPMDRMMPYWAAVPHLRHLDIGNSMGELVNDRNKFAVNVDVSQFKPEELKVNIDGRTVWIEGHHSEKSDRHGTIERSFKRSYLLPEDCKLENLQSHLSADGHLCVEAPKLGAIEGDRRQIPIQAKKAAVENGK